MASARWQEAFHVLKEGLHSTDSESIQVHYAHFENIPQEMPLAIFSSGYITRGELCRETLRAILKKKTFATGECAI